MPTDDEWQAAADAIFAASPPNPKPLAELIARATRIPAGVRDVLASMIDPDGPGYLRHKFELTRFDNKRDSHEKEISEIMPVAIAYNELVASGMLARDAAEAVAKKFGISEKSVFNHVKWWRDRLDWLKGEKSP